MNFFFFTKETPLVSLLHAHFAVIVACQRLPSRIIINARRHWFQNYGATGWGTRQIDLRRCRDDRISNGFSSICVRRRRVRSRTAWDITVQNARNPSRRATRCTGITDTNVTHCRVISAHIVAMSANGPIRSTIISGRSIRGRRSRWTSSTSPQWQKRCTICQ